MVKSQRTNTESVDILFLTKTFFPSNKISGVRPTNLSKYLAKLGFSVAVICTEPRTRDLFEEKMSENVKYLHNVHYIFSPYNRYRERNGGINNDLKFKLRYVNRYFVYLVDRLYYYYKAKSLVKAHGYQSVKIIFSTFSPEVTHVVAHKLKKSNSKAYWISDFRDPVHNKVFRLSNISKIFSKIFTRHFCMSANVITGVSQGCLDSLYFDSHPNKVVLPNGFDRDDIADIDYSIKQDKLTFSYLGALYSGKRDLSMLFRVLADLIASTVLNREDICIQYAGPSRSDLLRQASSFDLLDIIEASDSVPREQSLKKQLESHILILATWNNVGEEGVITGKFYEYMIMDRPIIALVSGNLANSKVKEMMEEGNLGICYEEATKEQDEEKLKEYILQQYTLFKEGKALDFSPNREYIDQFDYRNITKQLISLFPEHLRVAVDQEDTHA